jgi:Ca-activated chloride channel family protein
LGAALAAAAAFTLPVAARQVPVPQPGTAQPPQAAAQAPPAAAFRSGVDLVSLNVTATDGSGRFVRDLAEPDFLVFEDGIQQDIAFFSRTSLPLSVSILLDTSASMDEKLGTVHAAASGFVAQLRPDDQAEIIDFDSRVTVTVPFTADRAALDKGIRATTAGGSTALYNAVYIALKELRKLRETASSDLRRQAIVMLSDGEDTSSLVGFEEVLELARRSETVIYAIALKSKDYVTTKGYNEADYVLRQLTTQTGGRVFFPDAVDQLPGIYRIISDELSAQYALGYSSKNGRADGRWRRVVVRITRPGVGARTRQGYYGPAPAR